MKFTRKEIITAIMTEPLAANTWIRSVLPSRGKPFKEDCQVCAVGGLFRRKLVRTPGMTISKVYKIVRSYFGLETGQGYLHGGAYVGGRGDLDSARILAEQLVSEGSYLAALSVLFETYAKIEGVGMKMRRRLAAEVRKLFPVEFETPVNLGG